MTAALFTPIRLAGRDFANRIVISPMCQYSAVEGAASDWHMIHLGQMALSGAALLFVEATAVEPQGRISHGDLGLYDDRTEAALARVLKACRAYGNVGLGIQLAHSGRKGSAQAPWVGGGPITPHDRPWETIAPSAVPFAPGWPAPRAFVEADFARVKQAFVDSAKRALRLDFDVLELHAAHGYLLHEFLSPISNRRTDRYGGSIENRMRFPLEIFASLRAVWPRDRPLGARITGSDWIDGGWTVEDAIAFARELKRLGGDFVDVSSGGVTLDAKVSVGPGYQVPFAAAVRRATGQPTMAVGMITAPLQANDIVKSGSADMVALARGFLDDPRWAWRAARELGAEIAYPPQYARSHPKLWRVDTTARPTAPPAQAAQ